MATLQEYYNRYDRIRSRLSGINAQITFLNDEVRRGAVFGPPDNIGSRANALDDQINSAIDGLNALSEEIASSDLTASQQETLQRVIAQTGEGYLDAQQLLVGIRSAALGNERAKQLREETQPKDSAGEIVKNEAESKEPDAVTQSPPEQNVVINEQGQVVTQPQNTNTATNARQTEQANDATANENTDGQFGNDAQGGATSQVGGAGTPKKIQSTQQSNGQPSATSPSDDAQDQKSSSVGVSTSQGTRAEVAKEFLQPIVARENLLAGLSNMTYSFSLYLLNVGEYAQLVASQKKVLPSKQLLIQSGGATKGERNPWFNVDFYIEDLQIESVVGTQATGSPHNAVTLDFTIVEPQGITFLNRLNNAVIQHVNSSGQDNTNAFAQNYLLVVRFYGYDAAGNRVSSSELGLEQTTDENAIIEKFIPFLISNFNYKITSKATEYKISGVCQGTELAFSTKRASIPFNLQLVASDVDTLFNGNLVLAQSQADEQSAEAEPGANPENVNKGLKDLTVAQGLTAALNEHQRRLASKSYEIADQYEIVFEDIPGLKNALLAQPDTSRPDKNRAPNITVAQSASRYLESKTVFNKNAKTFTIQSGMQIVQLIDLVMRTSSYITSQQNVVFDEKTGQVKSNNPKVQTVQWYRIRTQITPLGYDSKRKDIAYKIKYIVSRYQINTPRTPYFPPAEYRGVHKLYNYWFTGQNTEVLDFEIDVNSNYFTVIGNDGQVDETPTGKFASKQSYSVAPGGSLQAGNRGSSVPAANLSDRLYNYADVASTTLDIVGDPDWLQQSEIFYNKTIDLNPFMPDGSVNYDASEVLFELRFNPVQDYDLETGLTPVYENNASSNTVTGEQNIPQETLVWAATTVTSTFSEGKFTQKINGVYRDFASSKNYSTSSTDNRLIENDQAVINAYRQGVIDTPDEDPVDPQSGLLQAQNYLPYGPNTPKPDKTIRLDSNGNRVNYNVQQAIDSGLPSVVTQEGEQVIRIVGTQQQLQQYVGQQVVPQQPGSGANAVNEDAGDYVKRGFI